MVGVLEVVDWGRVVELGEEGQWSSIDLSIGNQSGILAFSLHVTTALLFGLSVVGGRERDIVLTVDGDHPVWRHLPRRDGSVDFGEDVGERCLHIRRVESRRLDEGELIALSIP
jgi:hypothetical protein